MIGSVLGLPSFYAYFDLDPKGPNAARTNSILGATSGLFAGGGAIGALILTWLADKVGRVRALQITCALCVLSAAIEGGSVHIIMFLLGRFVSGVGVGLIVTLVPIYQSEISPAEVRGRMVGSHGFLIVTGYVGAIPPSILRHANIYDSQAISAWTGYGCYFSNSPAFQWRFELSVQALAPLILLIGSPLLPESPRWLTENGRHEEAFTILCKLHRDPDNGPDHIKAREEFYQMSTQIDLDKEVARAAGKWALFTKPTYRKRLLFGCFTQFILQSTGVLVINNYQVLLYNSLGLFDSVPLLLYAVYLSWAAAMNYLSSRIMDRVGRVRLLVIGLTGCTFAIICEIAMVAEFSGTANKVGNGFGVFFLFLFVTFYGSSLDATSYVYCAEIFPTHIRASGMGISIFSQFSTTLVYTQVAPTAFASIGWKYYLVFIILPALGVGFIWKFFPETKGLSLEEIAEAFGDEVAVDLTHLDTTERKDLDQQLRDTSEKELAVHHEAVASRLSISHPASVRRSSLARRASLAV